MSDNLEKFVRRNRRDFDSASPAESVWERIERGLPPGSSKQFSLRDVFKWSAAAALLFIVLTSLYFLVLRKHSHEVVKTAPPVETVSPGGIDPEYAAVFKEMYRSIGERQIELRSATAGQPALYRQFQTDLSALDSAFQALNKQAENSPNRDLIIEAMIQNLRLQAELLARQLMISRDITNQQKKVNHEKDI